MIQVIQQARLLGDLLVYHINFVDPIQSLKYFLLSFKLINIILGIVLEKVVFFVLKNFAPSLIKPKFLFATIFRYQLLLGLRLN